MTVVSVCIIAAIGWMLLSVPLALLLVSSSSWNPLQSPLFFWLTDQWLMEGIELLVFLGIATMAVSHMRRRPAPLPSWWNAWGVWIGWSAFSFVYSIDRGESLRSWIFLLCCGFLALLVAWQVRARRQVLAWARGLGLAALAVGLQGIGQYISHPRETLTLFETLRSHGALQRLDGSWTAGVMHDLFAFRRVTGIFGWPNVFAGFLLLVLPIVMALCRAAQTRGERWVWAIGAGVLSLLLCATRSVTGLMAATCAGVISWALWRKGRVSANLLLLGTVLAVGVGGLAYRISGNASAAFTSSLESRIMYLQGAWHIVRVALLQGTGVGTFALAYQVYMPAGQHTTAHAHNTLAQYAAELGLIGMGCVVFFLVHIWRTIVVSAFASRRTKHPEPLLRQGFACGLLAFFLHSLLEWTFFEPLLVPLWWVVLGVLSGSSPTPVDAARSAARAPSTRHAATWLGLGVLGAVVVLRITVADICAARADYAAGQAFQQEALRFFDRAQQWDPWMARYPFQQGLMLLHRARLAEAAAQFHRATQLSPWDARAWTMLSVTASKRGQQELAISAMQQAALRDPNNPKIAGWLTQMQLHQQAMALPAQQKEAR